MTKRFTVDEKGYFDKKAMRYVTIDYLMDLVNGQDQKIKELEAEIESLTTNLEEDYILFKRDKNPIETKYCHECNNYETEYEEVYAFGDYETLTKTSCSMGHHILDNSDATNCPDYEYLKECYFM